MSCYVNFFLRAGEKWLPIGSFSRSSAVYAAFESAPWEKVRALTGATLESILREQEENIGKFEKSIEEAIKRRDMIASFNNSVEDKLDAMREEDEYISGLRETVDELAQAIAFTRTLMWIVDEADSSKYNERVEDCYNPDEYLYFGMECGSNPEIEG